MYFDQSDFDICCEWGRNGLHSVGALCDAVIVVDVLSFCTCVDVAVAQKAEIYPYLYKDDSACAYAESVGAILAGSRAERSAYSLSPQSLISIPRDTKLVLPSPNGARLSLSLGEKTIFAGCLRNAEAVARAAQSTGKRICVVPAGERWGDGSIRMAAEDFVGAGAIISCLPGSRSPEAEMAVSCFDRVIDDLKNFLLKTSSGKELNERGFAGDIAIASELNVSTCAPVLKNRAFVEWV